VTDKEVMQKAMADICAAKLCEFNSMSSRNEMLRLMDSAIATLCDRLDFYALTPVDVVAKVGSQRALAETLGVSQQAVAHWCKRGEIPKKHHANIRSWWGLM
jgi:DNA-binding transcriptional regulator YiaG